MEKTEEYFEIKEYLEDRLNGLGSEGYYIRESSFFVESTGYEERRIEVLKESKKPKFSILCRKPLFIGYVLFKKNKSIEFYFEQEFQKLVF